MKLLKENDELTKKLVDQATALMKEEVSNEKFSQTVSWETLGVLANDFFELKKRAAAYQRPVASPGLVGLAYFPRAANWSNQEVQQMVLDDLQEALGLRKPECVLL